MEKYNKLVRDKIPEIIKGRGQSLISHIANDEEYWAKLKEKLIEEVAEFNKEGDREELVDVLEVIDAIMDFKKFDKNEIESIKEDKINKRGAFKKRIILDES